MPSIEAKSRSVPTRRRPGACPKPEAERKTVVVGVRLTRAEAERLEALAIQQSTYLASLARRAVMDALSDWEAA